MCSSKRRVRSSSLDIDQSNVARINGRPVLQPTCNRVPSLLERRNSLMKTPQKIPTSISPSPLPSPKGSRTRLSQSPPISPKPKSPKTLNDPNGLSNIKISSKESSSTTNTLKRSNSVTFSIGAPGSLAAARREQVANLQAMRKMRIAHYGRTNSAKYIEKVVPIDSFLAAATSTSVHEKKPCGFLSPSSDPIYVEYHDEEWGVPAHDDKLLFELLVLTTAQVGSDWTSVLKKRQHLRDAFSGFDAEVVAKFNERKVAFICSEYAIELSQVRGAIDNANQILKIEEQFGSFDNYLWRFVNNKPITTQYKSCPKIPVKTSKSEAISKDMIKRGFRFVGPAVIHSFMQAAGLTNDHLITCPRHAYCSALAK